jgi:hypothetical protein
VTIAGSATTNADLSAAILRFIHDTNRQGRSSTPIASIQGKKIMKIATISSLAAALLAGVFLPTVSFAENDYYEGVLRSDQREALPVERGVDSFSTGSVARYGFPPSANRQYSADVFNSGDYFSGANRPN